MTLFYLVRHGENTANLTKEFSHRKVDYSLTPKGRLQAEQTAAVLRNCAIDAVYSSPLRRAVETAQPLAAAIGQEVVVLEEFREINVGALEDMPPTPEAWTQHNAILRAWRHGDLAARFPGGEDFYELWQRVARGYTHICARHPHAAVAVFAHGGVFACTIKALCPAIDLAEVLRQENHNCSITQVEVELRDAGSGAAALHGRLLAWAACNHLTGEAAELVSGAPAPSFFQGSQA